MASTEVGTTCTVRIDQWWQPNDRKALAWSADFQSIAYDRCFDAEHDAMRSKKFPEWVVLMLLLAACGNKGPLQKSAANEVPRGSEASATAKAQTDAGHAEIESPSVER